MQFCETFRINETSIPENFDIYKLYNMDATCDKLKAIESNT